jgi:hypothetical protein
MEYLVQGEPKETLDRIETYMIRANYAMAINRTEVSANFYRPGGCLVGLYNPGLIVVFPAQNSGYTRVTLNPMGGKATRDGERMMLEEFDATPQGVET